MALRTVDSKKDVWNSIKKFFVDAIETTEGIKLVFDREFFDTTLPAGTKVTQWASVTLDEIRMDVVSQALVTVYLYTRGDRENNTLFTMRDTVMNHLIDQTGTDQFKRVTLYDTSISGAWVADSTMLLYPSSESEVYMGQDDTRFMYITLIMKWGA